MLVLSRQRDEKIIIGGEDDGPVLVKISADERKALQNITDSRLAGLASRLLNARPLKILHATVDIRGDKVRHGFEAPIELPVHRKEVYDAVAREKKRGEKQSSSLPGNTQSNSALPAAPAIANGYAIYCPKCGDKATLNLHDGRFKCLSCTEIFRA